MSGNDLIHRFLFDDTDIRGEIVTIDSAFQEASAHQQCPPALLPLLGEFLAGAALLSEVLKFEGILTLQARSESDIAIVMAEATHTGNLRGILSLNEKADPALLAEKDLTQLLASGILTITIDPVKGQRYQGMVPIESPTLSACLESYFLQSEQLPTQIQLFSSTTQCGGLFLQCLPSQLVRDPQERENHWQTCSHLAATLSEDELFTLPHEQLLLRLFHELSCRVFTPKTLQFKCSCSRARSATALTSLGYSDALALLKEKHAIDIDCQFCGKLYRFLEEDLAEIFPQDHTLH